MKVEIMMKNIMIHGYVQYIINIWVMKNIIKELQLMQVGDMYIILVFVLLIMLGGYVVLVER